MSRRNRLGLTPNLTTRALWPSPETSVERVGDGRKKWEFSLFIPVGLLSSLTYRKILRHGTSGFSSHPKQRCAAHFYPRAQTRDLWVEWQDQGDEAWRRYYTLVAAMWCNLRTHHLPLRRLQRGTQEMSVPNTTGLPSDLMHFGSTSTVCCPPGIPRVIQTTLLMHNRELNVHHMFISDNGNHIYRALSVCYVSIRRIIFM
jgi:hypothetical protein